MGGRGRGGLRSLLLRQGKHALHRCGRLDLKKVGSTPAPGGGPWPPMLLLPTEGERVRGVVGVPEAGARASRFPGRRPGALVAPRKCVRGGQRTDRPGANPVAKRARRPGWRRFGPAKSLSSKPRHFPLQFPTGHRNFPRRGPRLSLVRPVVRMLAGRAPALESKVRRRTVALFRGAAGFRRRH